VASKVSKWGLGQLRSGKGLLFAGQNGGNGGARGGYLLSDVGGVVKRGRDNQYISSMRNLEDWSSPWGFLPINQGQPSEEKTNEKGWTSPGEVLGRG